MLISFQLYDDSKAFLFLHKKKRLTIVTPHNTGRHAFSVFAIIGFSLREGSAGDAQVSSIKNISC